VLVYNLSVEQYLLSPTSHYKFHLYYVMMSPCTCAPIYGYTLIIYLRAKLIKGLPRHIQHDSQLEDIAMKASEEWATPTASRLVTGQEADGDELTMMWGRNRIYEWLLGCLDMPL
jgi:hypothetical protein